MYRSSIRVTIFVLGCCLVAAPISDAFAQRGERRGGGPGPAARPAGPQMSAPRMSAPRMAAPTQFSRPAPMARPAQAPRMSAPPMARSAPQFARPQFRAAPRSAPAFRQAAPAARPAMRQQQRAVQVPQRQQFRAQRSQQPSMRAQRAPQRTLQTQQRQFQPSQRAQQQQQLRQQRVPQQAARPGAATRSAARPGFAAPFRQAAQPARFNSWPVRQAWRRGYRAAFVPWLGPVFWPYAYADIFSYTFWPYAYEDAYWAYVYDDFFNTVFWAPDAYSHYAYGSDQAVPAGRRSSSGSRAMAQTVQQLCGDPDKGITAWPFAEIERAVQPTPEQRALLDEMKQAAAQAADAFKASCGGSFAMTPTGRLEAMTARVSATLETVRMVRPTLERFYESLSDEQKARFNALGPDGAGRTARGQQQEANAQSASCGDVKPDLTNLPIERIEQIVQPSGAQKAALDRLREATANALDALQAACPNDVPLTPVGRLEAMEKRLEAMLQAANIVQPALQEFYASLSNEQKARFNTMSATAAR